MATQKMIALKDFCRHHQISPDFMLELHRSDVIELVLVKRSRFIAEKQLHTVEKIARLYNDLHINNIEGIQTILHLLSTLERKEAELNRLRNQLAFYL
jgi:hypothetical protein